MTPILFQIQLTQAQLMAIQQQMQGKQPGQQIIIQTQQPATTQSTETTTSTVDQSQFSNATQVSVPKHITLYISSSNNF